MPVYTYQGKKWNIPEDKVEKFLHDIPGANLYEEEAKLGLARAGALGGNLQDDYVRPNPYTENFLSDEERAANKEYVAQNPKTGTSFDNIQPGISMQSKPVGHLDLPQSESIKDTNKDIYSFQKAKREEKDMVKGQLSEFQEDLQSKIKERDSIFDEEQKKKDQGKSTAIRVFEAPNPYSGFTTGSDGDATNYRVAEHFVNEAQNLINNVESDAGILKGVKDTAFNPDTWLLGLGDLYRSGKINQIVDKHEKGEELTDSENSILDALALNMAANAYHQAPRQYKWGQIAGESLPFMVEFILNPVAGAGKGIAKTIAKRAISKFGATGAAKTAIKAGSRAIGDVVGAAGMTATTGAPRTIADALNRNLGQATFDFDENGKITYTGHEGGEDAITSALKAAGASTIEYASEMVGSAGAGALIGKAMPKGWTKAIKASEPNLIRGLRNSNLYKETKALMQKGQWSGTLGEYMEEAYGTAMNAIFIGDNKLSDLTDIDQQVDTFMGLALTGGVMGTVNTSAYVIDRTRTANQLKKADSEAAQYIANWDGIKEQLKNLPVEERSQTIKDVLKRNDLTIPAKKAFADYTRTLTYRDALLGAAEQKLEESRIEAEQNGIQLVIDDKRRGLLSKLNREKIELEAKLGNLANIPEDQFGEYIENNQLTDEQINDWNTYNQRRNEYNGLVKQLREEIDREIEPAIQDIKRVTRRDGQIIYADFGSEGTLPVVNGNVSINEDGSIDKQNTDDSLTVLMPNGKKRIISSKFISGSPIINTPAELEEEVRQNAYDIFVSPIEEAMNGTERFTEGTPVEYVDEKGQTQAGTVVSTQGNTVTVVPNDGNKSKIRTFTHDQLRNSLVKETLGDVQVRDEFTVDIPEGYKNIRPGQYKVQVEEIKDGTAILRFIAPGETDQYIPEATIEDIAAIKPIIETPQAPVETQEDQLPQGELSAVIPQEQEVPEIQEQTTPDVPPLSFIDQIPKGEKGTLIFEQAPIETTVGALGEVYEDQEELTEVVKATISNIQKQIEKTKTPKPTGDINKDIANKQAAKQQLLELNNKLEYWNSIQTAVTPIPTPYEERIASIEQGGVKKRESNMGEYLSLRDYLLRNIGTGKFKFLWKSNEGKKGLRDEIFSSKNTEPERRKRIAFLNNKDGYTPESLAEELFENAGQGSEINPGWFNDVQDIRNEIIDILLSHDTPTSMIDAATELRRQPESIEEYYENFVDPELMDQYGEVEEVEVYEEGRLPFEAMSDEELDDYFGDLEEKINFEEKNYGLEETRTGTDRSDADIVEQSVDDRGEAGDSRTRPFEETDYIQDTGETGITPGRIAQAGIDQTDREGAENESDRSIDQEERIVDEIDVDSENNTNFVENETSEVSDKSSPGEFGEGNEILGQSEEPLNKLRRRIETAQRNASTDNDNQITSNDVRHNEEQELQDDQRLEQERSAGREENARAARRLGRYRQANSRDVQDSQSSKSEQERELREYAEQAGLWLDEKDIASNAERKIPSGKEANVYLNKDGKTVTKVINYSKYSKNPLDFIEDRVLLFNELFDGTPYTIVGYTQTDKGFSFVVEQPYIKGTILGSPVLSYSVETQKQQQKRVADYMRKKFGMESAGLDAFSDGSITIQDLHLKNVIEGEDGNLYVIDAIPSIKEASEETQPSPKFTGDLPQYLREVVKNQELSHEAEKVTITKEQKLQSTNEQQPSPEPGKGIDTDIKPKKGDKIVFEIGGREVKFEYDSFISDKNGTLTYDYFGMKTLKPGEYRIERGGNVINVKQENGSNTKLASTEEREVSEKIEDFGEKIEGAKKDIWKPNESTEESIKTQPLSKTFPRPDFMKLVNDGHVSVDGALILKYLYEEIPSKPRKKHKLNSWVRKVKDAIDVMNQFVDNPSSVDEYMVMLNGMPDYFKDKILLYMKVQKLLGFPSEDINTGKYEIKQFHNSDGYSIVNAPYILGKYKTLEEAVDALKRGLQANKASQNKDEVKLYLYQDSETKKYFIGKKGATGIVRLMDGIETIEEARRIYKEQQPQLQEMWRALKVKPEERRERNRDRIGTDYRKGKNVKPELFSETFGFRGVQFGNWVNSQERQDALNDAYDALMDLSTALGISTRAISLNGELGLAFGARGSGKANAHYEPGQIVINLTKTKGAGSLAHEWWHALDNYFSRLRGESSSYLTEKPRQGRSMTGQMDERIRKEMIDAFKNLTTVINKSDLPKRSKELDKTRSKPYWSTIIEMSARSFENFIIEKMGQTNESNDYLANFKELGEWAGQGGLEANSYPYPTKDENEVINSAFQEFFDTIQEKVDEETGDVLLFRSMDEAGFYSTVEDALEKIKQEKGTKDQFRSMLLKNGAKQAELDWMGFDELPAKLTKQEIQEWIDQNRIEVEEVEKGAPSKVEVKSIEPVSEKYATVFTVTFSDNSTVEVDLSGKYDNDPSDISEREIAEEAQKLRAEDDLTYEGDEEINPTKYSQYVLPGGKNYKELLLTMPYTSSINREEVSNRVDSINAELEELRGKGHSAERISELLNERDRLITELNNEAKSSFKSSHFDELNILAHIRFNEREVNRERVLFIEEIQSDWAQEGRRKGFESDYQKELANLQNKLDQVNSDLVKTIEEAHENGLPSGASSTQLSDFSRGVLLTVERARLEARLEKVRNVRDWDEIQSQLQAISDKQQQIGAERSRLIKERDSLEEQIKRKMGKPFAEGVPDMPFKSTDQWLNLAMRRMMRYAAENGFDRIAWTTGEQQADRYDLSKHVDDLEYNHSTGQLIGRNKNSVVVNTAATKETLPDIVGKEAAEKLLSNPERTDALGAPITYRLQGEELKFGGEGMKSFYNQIVPKVANKLGKPFNTKVEEFELPEIGKQQSIPVTEAMKESVMEGVPLFRKRSSREEYAKREWNRAKSALTDIAKRLHVDVEILETTEGLTGKKSTAKGWYDPKTGKITIVMPNHSNSLDVQATLLHEAVGHHGLRELFGEHFDTFLDNVYNNADGFVKHAIDGIIKEEGLDQRTATEEYLSYLAEDRTLLDGDGASGWFGKVKQFFLEMLSKVGINLDIYLSDNELRYILWRSYQNLKNPGRYKTPNDSDREIQSKLKVGEFVEQESAVSIVAEDKENTNFAVNEYNKWTKGELDRLCGGNAAISRTIESARVGGGNDRATTQVGQGGGTRESLLGEIVQRAKENGTWIDDIQAVSSGEYIGHGQEHEVYRAKDGKSVVKLNNLDFIPKNATDLNDFINRALTQNELFPSDAFTILGFAYNSKREISVVLQQPYVLAEREATDEEIDQFLEDHGFTVDIRDIWSDGRYEITDLKTSNVLVDTNGRLRFIDVVAKKTNPPGDDRVKFKNTRIQKADTLMDNADNLKKVIKYPKFLSDVLNGPAKEKLLSEAREKGYTNLDKVIENYLSEVEDPEELKRIKELLGAEMPDNALRYLLWRNTNPNDGTPIWRIKDAAKKQSMAGDVLFRMGDIPTESQLEEYERRTKGRKFDFLQETFNDMLSLRVLQEIITGKKDHEIKSSENAYRAFKLYMSRSKEALDRYTKQIYEPMIAHLSRVNKELDGKDLASMKSDLEGNKATYLKATVYAMAKSGLSRMEWMARRDADAYKNKELNKMSTLTLSDEDYQKAVDNIEKKTEKLYGKYLDRDVSGLTALADLVGRGDENFKDVARSIVEEVESIIGQDGINDLWSDIRKSNQWVLQKEYEAGRMTKEELEWYMTTDEFYLPHRGFDLTTADDKYDYRERIEGNFNSLFKKAKGRTTLAEDPFAHIMSMAASGILEAEKNRAKQMFRRMIISNPNNIVTEQDVWIQNFGTEENPEWREVFAETDPDDTPEEVNRKLTEFQNRMDELSGNGMAMRKKNKLDLGVPIGKGNASEHAIRVWVGGEEKVMYVNGNPVAAQAINGTLDWHPKNKGIVKFTRTTTRYLSGAYTSYNPEFGVTNGLRDAHAALVFGYIDHGPRYSFMLFKNLFSGASTVANYVWNNKFSNNEYGKYMEEFLRNGGPTGFTLLKSIKDYEKEVKRINRQTAGSIDHFKMLRLLGRGIENFNQMIELNTRFATYVTSRQSGRTGADSAYDAKNITLNFEQHGARNSLVMKYLTTAVPFSNAALQGLYRTYEAFEKNPKRTAGMIGSHLAAGVLNPLLTVLMINMFGDDDDKEKYKNLPLWVKCNNFIIYGGDGRFFMYPLSHEFRWLYGIGVISSEAAMGNLRGENIPKLMAEQLTSMAPIDAFSGFTGFSPGILKPFVELSYNENFMGRPIYKKTPWNTRDPEWTKAYNNTWDSYVKASKKLNEFTGGDEVKKGWSEVKIADVPATNPNVAQHLTRSLFGGGVDVLGNAITLFSNMAYNIQQEAQGSDEHKEINPSDIPFLRRVYRKSTDRDMDAAINRDIQHVFDFMQDFEHLQRGYKKRLSDKEYAKKYGNLLNGEDRSKYNDLKNKQKLLDKLKDMPGTEDRVRQIRKDMVEIFWEDTE